MLCHTPAIEGPLPARAFVGLGSNLGNRVATLCAAARALAAVATTTVTACSSLYETRPLGPAREPFLNAVVELETMLEPTALLAGLLAIERAHGRERRERWASRTLDLDLLLYLRGDATVELHTRDLALPHPELCHRDFVLVPLAELAPALAVAAGHTPAALAARLAPADRTILRRLARPTEWAAPPPPC
jgi:2-amino-4-hydroxy-6-hydroxymethyldihydropteridine diphosphokinase